jgi:hypothetical protein
MHSFILCVPLQREFNNLISFSIVVIIFFIRKCYCIFILNELHGSQCSAACSAIDHICTFVIQQTAKQKPKQHWLLSYLTQYQNVLPYLFTANFSAVLFEERQNQWSLSRPLLCLILLNPDVRFTNYYVIL